MGLGAIHCKGTSEVRDTNGGAGITQASDFSGKDVIAYAGIMTAIAAVSGCVSSYQNDNAAITGGTKNEVQPSASGGDRDSDSQAANPSGNDELPPHLEWARDGAGYPFKDRGPSYFSTPFT